MRYFLIASAFTFAGAALFAAEANAWERRGSFTGPRGNTFQYEGRGNCSGGRCSYDREVTGPRGNTWRRSGEISRDGNGGWSREGTVTGPGGYSATYGGSGQCSGGTCTYGGSRKGPAGTSTWSGQASRY